MTFRGHVQGVGFRVSAHNLAKGFQLTGFVQNADDGAVQMEVQGDPAQIETYLIDLREHLSGYIREEQAETLPIVDSEPVFEIRH